MPRVVRRSPSPEAEATVGRGQEGVSFRYGVALNKPMKGKLTGDVLSREQIQRFEPQLLAKWDSNPLQGLPHHTAHAQMLRFQKYDHYEHAWTPEMYAAWPELARILRRHWATSKVISWEEALSKFDESKSPGPLELKWGTTKKECKNSASWRKMALDYDQRLTTHECAEAWFGMGSKDEVLSIEKVEKPRFFAPAPFCWSIATAEFTYEQNEAYCGAPLVLPSTAGLGVNNGIANHIAKRLDKCPVVYDYDFHSCDANVPATTLWAIAELRADCLGLDPVQRLKWANVRGQMVNCAMVNNQGDVYDVIGGNKSGGNDTMVDNGIHCILMMLAAWVKLTLLPAFRFWDFVILYTIGDDGLWGNLPGCPTQFTKSNVFRVWESWGYPVDDADFNDGDHPLQYWGSKLPTEYMSQQFKKVLVQGVPCVVYVPKEARILGSLLYKGRGVDIHAHHNKLVSLYYTAYFTELRGLIFRMLEDDLDRWPGQLAGVPNARDVERWHTGREGHGHCGRNRPSAKECSPVKVYECIKIKTHQKPMTAELPRSDGDGLPSPIPHDVTMAERQLHKAAPKLGLSPAGERALIAACDPYHDHTLEVDGYPDYAAINSQVEVIKRKMTVQAPDLADGKLWDCHIAFLPIGNSCQISPAVLASLGSSIILTPVPDSNPVVGTVTAVAVPTGDLTFPDSTGAVNWSTAVATSISVTQINSNPGDADRGRPTDTFTDGCHRIIGLGFEVTNTTAMLYRGGSVSCYSQDQNRTDFVAVSPGGLFANVSASRAPPSLDRDEFLTPDAVQWGAEKGAYVVAKQSGFSNPFSQAGPKCAMILGKDFTPGKQDPQNCWVFTNGYNPGEVPGQLQQNTSRALEPFCGSGAYFSGLPKGTVLTVTMRAIVERAASVDQGDMLVVSRPSPAYDPAFFTACSEIWRKMPPGTQKDNNFLGTWFRDAVSTVVKHAAPLVKAIAPVLAPHVKKHLPKKAAEAMTLAEDIGREVKTKVKANKKKAAAKKAMLALE